MKRNGSFDRVEAAASAGLFALLLLTTPAAATDPVFPPGSRIGLVPPNGMVASDKFVGFADPAKNAAILLTVLPVAAYAQIEKTLEPESLRKQDIKVEKREPLRLRTGKAFLLSGRQTAGKERYRKWLLIAAIDDLTALVSVQIPERDSAYPDSAVRAALTTLAVRANVPAEEELGLLPFTVGDLAGFHIDNVLRGRAIILSDTANENPKDSSTDTSTAAPPENAAGRLYAHLLVAAVPGGPAELDDRANFARLAFNEIAGIKNVHVTISEPLRIGGQPGYQTMAEAKDLRTGTDIMVVQWLRFGGGGFLQMIGIGRADNWTTVLSRLRTVRDSVELR
jgi:hypothetical protein